MSKQESCIKANSVIPSLLGAAGAAPPLGEPPATGQRRRVSHGGKVENPLRGVEGWGKVRAAQGPPSSHPLGPPGPRHPGVANFTRFARLHRPSVGQRERARLVSAGRLVPVDAEQWELGTPRTWHGVTAGDYEHSTYLGVLRLDHRARTAAAQRIASYHENGPAWDEAPEGEPAPDEPATPYERMLAGEE